MRSASRYSLPAPSSCKDYRLLERVLPRVESCESLRADGLPPWLHLSGRPSFLQIMRFSFEVYDSRAQDSPATKENNHDRTLCYHSSPSDEHRLR
jgi:hypothetical protein